MKIVNFKGMDWKWPERDSKLLQVNNWVADLQVALPYVKNFRTAVQAGGAIGIWPVELAGYFQRVFTFEPNEENYACLEENVKPFNNVYPHMQALGKEFGYVDTKLHPSEEGNSGAYYTMPVNDQHYVAQRPLDELELGHVDFIQLDVEGRELEVLKGAVKTIFEHEPVIMIEEKPLPQDNETGHVVGEAEKFLNKLGYKCVAKPHRDMVFVYG